jgi:hypothetical protein
VAFSSDGKRIISAGLIGTFRICEARNRQEVFTLKGHLEDVSSVAFSRDGKRIRSQDEKGNRLDFDAVTGKPLPPDEASLPAEQLESRQPGGGLIARAEGALIRVAPPGADDDKDLEVLDCSRDHIWHAAQAEEYVLKKEWPAAVFHLERLHRIDPRARPRLLAALKEADDSPLIQTIKRNLAITDAARAASAVGQPGLFGAGLLALPAPQAGPR